jgi:hypothetical protein
MLIVAGMEMLQVWYRPLLFKHSLRYPNFRLFKKIDQSMAGNFLP